MIAPIKNSVLFQFEDEVRAGRFQDVSAAGIILGSAVKNQTDVARWGRVVAIGPDVSDVNVGDRILIEATMWTSDITTEDDVRLWRTDDTKIIGVATEG